MEVFYSPKDLTSKFSNRLFSKKSIGFVPTMGALHMGHASLVTKSKEENELTVVSIFVNPTQFGPKEDLGKYPRTPEKDLAILQNLDVDYVLMPEMSQIYPFGTDEVGLNLKSMDKVLCGASRPGHFNGVVQVVNKLMNIVRPDRAYFGLKDFQQWTILRRMAAEFFYPVEIIGCSTIRETDGLAMSSRNQFIENGKRQEAIFLFRALSHIKISAKEGMDASELIKNALEILKDFPSIKLDYLEIRRETDLGEIHKLRIADKPRTFVAAWCGGPRLIDNLEVFN